MAGLAPSATSEVWPRTGGSATTGPSFSGPTPFGGGGSFGLPTINNQNLPPGISPGYGGLPPPVPQQPTRPFPSLQQLGAPNSLTSQHNYATANTLPSFNQMPMAMNLGPNLGQVGQNEANQRRLMQLEDDSAQRRNANLNIQQMGTQLLQGQMDVQEQVLQYQFMLEQCMETLDHQNYVVNEQSEELALLRAKMRHFEYLMDALKHSKDGGGLFGSNSGDCSMMDANLLCCRDPLSLPAPSTSPFFAGGPTRITASTFQPFNPRYRSPNTRATAAANLSGRRSATPSIGNRNLPNANERPSRRLGNVN